MGGLEHRSSRCKGPGAVGAKAPGQDQDGASLRVAWCPLQEALHGFPSRQTGFSSLDSKHSLTRLPTRLTLTVLSWWARSPSGTSRIPTAGDGAWPAVYPRCGVGAPPLGEKEVPFFVSLLDPSMPGPRKVPALPGPPRLPQRPLTSDLLSHPALRRGVQWAGA